MGYIEYEPKLTLTPGVSYNISFECKALERYFNNVSDGISNGTGTTYGDKVPWVHLYSETVADTQGSIKTLTDNTPSPTGGNWESGKHGIMYLRQVQVELELELSLILP